MTRDEVRFLLGRFGAAYGRRPPTAAVVDEWERALRRYPAVDAHATLDRLIDQGDPGPSLPAFVAQVRALHPTGPRVVPDPVAPLELWGGPTQRGRDLVAKAKSILRHPSTQEDR